MTSIRDWSGTAGSNLTVAGISIAEGCAAANLNDMGRAIMADVANWRAFLEGSKTTAGTANVQTLTSGLSISSLAVPLAFKAKIGVALTNTGATTLALDALSAKNVKRSDGSALTAGDLTAGGVYDFAYEATADVFILSNPTPFNGVPTTAALVITDNRIVRGDGGARGMQESNIVVDDSTGTIYPSSDDLGSLGKSGTAWSDAFLASGGVINWNAANYTITHSPGLLTASGALTVTGALVGSSTFSIGTSNAATVGTIELGNASDTTIARVSAGVVSVESVTLASLGIEGQTVTGGGIITSKSLGTVSSGTLTLSMGDRALQHYTNNGAHTLAPGTNNGSTYVDITNGASAGAITTSGWTKVVGSSFTTTNGNKFRCSCSVGNGGSLLSVQALQ